MSAEERRRQREAQLAQMTPEERVAELKSHRKSDWQERRLRAHAEKHGEDFIKVIGRAPTPDQLRELSRSIVNQPNAVLAEINEKGQLEYHFIRFIEGSQSVIIVTSRQGFVRTTYPGLDYARWVRRHSAAVER